MATFKCANSKCKTKKVEELMYLNIESKKDAKKERCTDCFETYLRRNGMSEYYYLIGLGDDKRMEPDESESREHRESFSSVPETKEEG